MIFKSLENEFEFYKALNKIKVVKRKIVDYYETLEQTEINLSGAYYESPEKKADYAIRQMILNDLPKFEHLYQVIENSYRRHSL